MRRTFCDPAFERIEPAVTAIIDTAWEAYTAGRKSPRTRAAGPGFADPSYELSLEWLEARSAIAAAQARQRNAASPARVLLICASARTDQTCPSEMSKTFRMTELAAVALRARDIEVDRLDLSDLTAEFGRRILPCKGCVSTAMPLCHWPCSCYPNHGLRQDNDWMNELYPRFAAAHGVMIVTPVYWYQAPAVLKLLMDRLVCADGGNPDPSSTHGKDPQRAKALEMAGWDYPRHLAGRAFAIVVHGDAAGGETLRRTLTDWLEDMQLHPAGSLALLDRYVGYYGRYAESHESLDRDQDFQQEVRNAALTLADAVFALRRGAREPGSELSPPRPK